MKQEAPVQGDNQISTSHSQWARTRATGNLSSEARIRTNLNQAGKGFELGSTEAGGTGESCGL